LRLRINHDKSAVARLDERHFLGFRLRRDPRSGAMVVLLSERTKRNAMARIRELTPRGWGSTLESCISRINAWLAGWHQFFGIAAASEEFTLRALDAHIRRRLRAIVLKHWRRKRTIARNLVALGVKRQSAWKQVYVGRKSTWALSHSPAVDKAMPVKFFTERGLIRLVDLHRENRRDVVAPTQLQLELNWG
jgi:RNA-directed DNA polymerase